MRVTKWTIDIGTWLFYAATLICAFRGVIAWPVAWLLLATKVSLTLSWPVR